jgi:hypothetical protein
MQRKIKYRIRNWSQYNKSLIQRGSINIWFSEEVIKKWIAPKRCDKKGRPFKYADDTILAALIIRSVFHLPLRSLQGFLLSLITLCGVDLPIPSYTQISRRSISLGKKIKKLSLKRVTELVIDSTGLKVYGEGEWKTRQHGYNKRRTWRKLHLAICPDSGMIVCEELTSNSIVDSEVFPDLIAKVPRTVKRTYGDGAYDKKTCYQSSSRLGIKHIAPPQKNAVFQHDAPSWMKDRNDAVLAIRGFGGDAIARKLWKIFSGYHRRSLAETTMFRFKQLFGGNLRCRLQDNQKAEARAKSIALNKMTSLGMPKGEWCYC